MGKRAATADSEEELARRTLAQLNGQIALTEWSLHGIPAPARRPHRCNPDRAGGKS
ncbi:MAG TPA: hypothetical protein VGN55_14580 [Xanthobacteraceae bacterium]|jgi:hypothetical protein